MPDPAIMDRYYPETYYGSGRANLLRFLKELGCNCYGTERSKFPADSQLAGIKVFIGWVSEGVFDCALGYRAFSCEFLERLPLENNSENSFLIIKC